MNFQQHYLNYKALVDARLPEVVHKAKPRSLYEPTRHILSSGGKRIRPVLVMLACEAVGGTGTDALDAGVAVEILHNFTLVHDDIMDNADTRRGRETVHVLWDEGTAILVGDVMIGIAQKLLLDSRPQRALEVVKAFNNGIIDVCEGQSLDREYETRSDVTLDDYLEMITMKTGRLVEMAAEVGGLVGNGTNEQIDALRAYARDIGIAFQIQDDLLDIIADEAEFGKQVGRDIMEGKRTYLIVRALAEITAGPDRALLDRFLNERGLPEKEVHAIRTVFASNGILGAARMDVERYVADAEKHLERLPDSPARSMLSWFAQMLMNRNS